MDYQKLYTLVFNGVTDAIREIETQNYGNANQILKKTQVDAEELYLLQEDA